MLAHVPGQRTHDRPEVGTRVFKLKLTELLEDLTKNKIFGESRRTPEEIDDIISAELPSPTDDPTGYKAVTNYMLHGPCGKDAREGINIIMSTDWFALNERHPPARARTYAKIPHYYVCYERLKMWKPQKQRKCIGRIVYSTPASGIASLLLPAERTAHNSDGKLPAKMKDGEDEPTWIQIPEKFLINASDSPIAQIVVETYPNFIERQNDDAYLKERAILTPRNDDADAINAYMFDKLESESITYYSADEICKASTDTLDQQHLYPVESLNTLNFPGMPPHALK
nr:ATP-dependent DNA helicase PIF1-like [Tanacetum cinerariifolium]